MDFSKILDSWENRRGGGTPEPFDKDEVPVGPVPLPPRGEMEKAVCEGELNLHGLVQDEALAALRLFLKESREAGLRKVLVIHGKGLHSENRKGILREAVQQVLLKDRNVAAWGEAGRKQGGRGASWVWLKINVRGK